MSPTRCPNCQTENRPGARFCLKCGTALAPAPAPPPPPEPVSDRPTPNLGTGRLPAQSYLANRYIILQKVGQGGMGAVYKAADSRLTGRVIAIKEMSDAAITTPQERRQALTAFQREAELLTRLRHANLPRVTDTFAIGNRHYLVMDFIEGETLEQKLNRGDAPFPEAQVLAWASQLCDVLGYLHNQEPPVIFRDLKPGNIIIDPAGQVKLIDFGIARFFKHGKSQDTMIMGTPGYASPEQYGTQQTDARSDIYSLGATLFHLSTGRDPGHYPPYQLPPARQANPTVSPHLEKIIATAVHPSAERRFNSMAEMQAALSDRRTTGRPATAPTPRPGPTPPPPDNSQTHRPTTRLLLLSTARFSNRQLSLIGLAILAIIILATWFLVPILRQFVWFWNNFPSIAIIAPLTYTAMRRRWAAGIAQALTAFAGSLVVSLQADQDNSLLGITAGALLSALLIEGLIALLPRITGHRSPDAPGVWLRELLWLALTTTLGFLLLSTLSIGTLFYLTNPLSWFLAALLGGLGWFIGDLIYSYNDLRRSGRRQH